MSWNVGRRCTWLCRSGVSLSTRKIWNGWSRSSAIRIRVKMKTPQIINIYFQMKMLTIPKSARLVEGQVYQPPLRAPSPPPARPPRPYIPFNSSTKRTGKTKDGNIPGYLLILFFLTKAFHKARMKQQDY